MQHFPPGMLPKAALVAALLLATVSVSAETVGLTLPQALALAQDHNPGFLRSRNEVQARKRQNSQAFATFLPSLSVSPGLSRANAVPESPGGSGPPWSGTASVGVSVSLALSSWVDIETARSTLNVSQASLMVAHRTLEKTVKTTFYGLLLQQEGLMVEVQARERIRSQCEHTQVSHRAGLVSDLELMAAQVSLATAQNSVEALRQALIRQKEQFFLFLSPDLGAETLLIGSLPDPATFEDGALDRPGEAPELAVLRAQLQGAQTARALQARAPWLPTVTMGWTAAPSRPDLGSPETRWIDTGSLTLGATWSLNSLLPWGTTAETRAQLDDQIVQLQSQYDEESRLHGLQKNHQERQITHSLSSLRVLAANLALAQKAYDLTAEAYRRGTRDGLALRAAEGELQKASYSILNERYNLAMAAVNLEYETAGPGDLGSGVQ